MRNEKGSLLSFQSSPKTEVYTMTPNDAREKRTGGGGGSEVSVASSHNWKGRKVTPKLTAAPKPRVKCVPHFKLRVIEQKRVKCHRFWPQRFNKIRIFPSVIANKETCSSPVHFPLSKTVSLPLSLSPVFDWSNNRWRIIGGPRSPLIPLPRPAWSWTACWALAQMWSTSQIPV